MRTAGAAPRSLRHWPRWAGYAAGVWSLAYGLLGLWWAMGGAGFPFGEQNDPGAVLSVFGGVRAETGAPVISTLGLAGALAAMVMVRARGHGVFRAALLVFAWMSAVVLSLVVPDYRVLVAVAYAPIFLVGAPFGWPPASFLEAVPWPVINQFVCIGGGLSWAATAVAYGRRTRGACGNCGRTGTDAGWRTPAAAAKWGRWAVSVAVIVPVLYAVTRWAWALGIPLGISEEFLREGQEIGLWWAGAGLATIAVGGAVLTLGLVQKWGEVFPRWIPFLRGGRVPIPLAVFPASVVSVLVTDAGLMFVRLTLTGKLGVILGEGVLGARNWAALAPELLWPLWGAALAAATLAYYYRRRGRCEICGRH
ncbi:MAG: hypothetical protein H0V21_07320 [Rubrobacter sp.]|nr:hypothetical protein [Rubrobacter sp.]